MTNEKLTPELKALLLIVLTKNEITSEQKNRLSELLDLQRLVVNIVDK